MTEKKIENRIKKIKELEAQIAELEQQADVIRCELKEDMEEKGVDELTTKNFVIRWKEVVTNRLDGKALKNALPEIYNQYVKPSTSRRFTIV